jgi:hypothetical protein
MGIFVRQPSLSPTPPWTGTMTRADYTEFCRLRDDWLRTHGRKFRDLEDGGVEVETSEGKLVLGMVNLIQNCQLVPRDRWAEQVATHFGNVLTAPAGLGLSFGQARDLLKVRVYPAGIWPPEMTGVCRPIAEGLVAALVLDFPTTNRTVNQDEADGWGVQPDELFQLGLEHVRAEDVPQLVDLFEAPFHLLAGNSFFTATWLLMLDSYLEPSQHGALVVVPSRHMVAFHSIVDKSVLGAIAEMLPFAYERCQEGPGSIVPNLYWRRGQNLTLLPSRREHGQILCMPPVEFAEMLTELPDAPADRQSVGATGRRNLAIRSRTGGGRRRRGSGRSS